MQYAPINSISPLHPPTNLLKIFPYPPKLLLIASICFSCFSSTDSSLVFPSGVRGMPKTYSKFKLIFSRFFPSYSRKNQVLLSSSRSKASSNTNSWLEDNDSINDPIGIYFECPGCIKPRLLSKILNFPTSFSLSVVSYKFLAAPVPLL